jgi:hypothetical protein
VFGIVTGVLWGLLVLFAGGDAAAHFTHYRGGETVSASIWWLERRFPIFHILVGLALGVLFTHLEFRIP